MINRSSPFNLKSVSGSVSGGYSSPRNSLFDSSESTKNIALLGMSIIFSFFLTVFEFYFRNGISFYLPLYFLVLNIGVSVVVEYFWASFYSLSVFLVFSSSLSFVNYVVLLYYISIGHIPISLIFLIFCLYSVILLFSFSSFVDKDHLEVEDSTTKEKMLSFLVVLIPSVFILLFGVFLKKGPRKEVSFSSMGVSLLVVTVYSIFTYNVNPLVKKIDKKLISFQFSIGIFSLFLSSVGCGISLESISEGIAPKILCSVAFILSFLFFCLSVSTFIVEKMADSSDSLHRLRYFIAEKGNRLKYIFFFTGIFCFSAGWIMTYLFIKESKGFFFPFNSFFKIMDSSTFTLSDKIIDSLIDMQDRTIMPPPL